MAEKKKTLTEAQKKAAAFLTRAKPDFSGWRTAREVEVAKAEAEVIAKAKAGDVMPNGSIYVGISPDTQERMFVTAQDASLSMNFNDAAIYAKGLAVHGRKDWRLPTLDELKMIFQNKEEGALKGTFNATDSSEMGPHWYWSSTEWYSNPGTMWVVRFSAGDAGIYPGDRTPISCRPVRFAPALK